MDKVEKMEKVVTESRICGSAMEGIEPKEFLARADCESEFEHELRRKVALDLLDYAFVSSAGVRPAMFRVYLLAKANGLCDFKINEIGSFFGVSAAIVESQLKELHESWTVASNEGSLLDCYRSFFEFLFSAGLHPADSSRKLYSLSCALGISEVLELSMRDLGKLVGEAEGCRQWRLRAMMSRAS